MTNATCSTHPSPASDDVPVNDGSPIEDSEPESVDKDAAATEREGPGAPALPRQMIGITRAAELAELDRYGVLRLVDRGELRAWQLGEHFCLDEDEVLALAATG